MTDDRKILSDIRNSQQNSHLQMGGVVPLVARFKHLSNIETVVRKALHEASCDMKDISAIAVANCPGLILSLDVGVKYAQRLSIKHQKPLIGVHHMEAHALVATLTSKTLKYPFLALLVSGGHSLIAFVASLSEFYLFGDNVDSAFGMLDCCDETLSLEPQIFPRRSIG